MPRAIFEMVEFTGGEERSFVLANVFTFPGQEFRQDRRDCYLFRVPCFPIRNAHARADTYGYPIFSEFFHRPSTDFSSTDPLYTFLGAFLTGTGARCRVFREQTFAKPVKLASHFKVKSGPLVEEQ